MSPESINCHLDDLRLVLAMPQRDGLTYLLYPCFLLELAKPDLISSLTAPSGCCFFVFCSGINIKQFNNSLHSQFVQRFNNIMDWKDRKCRDRMLSYIGDLMEDTTDFSWGSAKSAHARWRGGAVDWFDSDIIDRIHRGHAQCYTVTTKQSWSKSFGVGGRSWFCKAFQTGLCQYNKDHEVNGLLNKHICASVYLRTMSYLILKRIVILQKTCCCKKQGRGCSTLRLSSRHDCSKSIVVNKRRVPVNGHCVS